MSHCVRSGCGSGSGFGLQEEEEESNKKEEKGACHERMHKTWKAGGSAVTLWHVMAYKQKVL